MKNLIIGIVLMKINTQISLFSLYLKTIKTQYILLIDRRLRSCTCY
jgi:hypothetical protein